VGFESAIPASERPQNRALDGAATAIGIKRHCRVTKDRISETVESQGKQNQGMFRDGLKNYPRRMEYNKKE
jgi:hypothetical protein